MRNKKNPSLPVAIVTLNCLAALLYYSPVTLYGYWADVIFLFSVAALTLFLVKRIFNGMLRVILSLGSVVNLIALVFATFSFWGFILRVHFIPAGESDETSTYAYFLERGNSGLTSGCYGEIQYHRKVEQLPFLEIKCDVDTCSEVDYNTLIDGNY